MKPIRFLLVSILLTVISLEASGAESLRSILKDEVSRLNAVYGLNVIPTLGNDSDTDARPNGSIYLNEAQITKLASTQPNVPPDDVYRFVVGHEMVHELQFKLYGTGVLDGGFQRRLYECQADMLASEDLIQTGKLTKERGEMLKALVRTAAMAGTEPYSAQDHPSGDQRRIAVQYGLIRGLLMIESHKSPSTQSAEGIAVLRRATDWREGESETAWALRISRRITHQDYAAASSLAGGAAVFHWNKDPDHPYVDFAVPYTNSSQKALHAEIQIQSVAVQRYYGSDSNEWQRVDDEVFELDLQPGETRTVSGRLEWYGNEDWLARVLVPPEKGTLYSASFVGEKSTPDSSSGSGGATSVSADAISKTVGRYLGNADKGYSDFIAAQIAERIDLGDGDFSDVYPATQSVPGASKTDIWHSKDGSSYVRARLYDGYSENGAREVYNTYSQLLAQKYPRQHSDALVGDGCVKGRLSYAVTSPDATARQIQEAKDTVQLSIGPQRGGKCRVNLTIERSTD